MRLMTEAGRRSPRVFNEVCLPGDKIGKLVGGLAYFSRIGLGGRFQEPISEHTFYEDCSFSAINTEEVVSGKKGIIKRNYDIPDLCRRKVNVKEICDFRRWS